MSSSSVVAAVLLGITTCSASTDELGVRKGQKFDILLGALARAWASVTSACSSVALPLQASARRRASE
ncbi:hypothetical protein LZ023_14290 [Pseudomonas silvicola]|nr:hypothetical protein LZ023_14290 [Pseudomonas silvicola]